MGSGGTLGALRSVWSNEAVRRAQLALAGSTIGDWSYGVAISVLVYDQAGAAWVGIAQVCRLVPAAIVAPLLSAFVDRYPKQRVLFATDAARATCMTGICLCAAAGCAAVRAACARDGEHAREHAVLAGAGSDAADPRARAGGADRRERRVEHRRIDRVGDRPCARCGGARHLRDDARVRRPDRRLHALGDRSHCASAPSCRGRRSEAEARRADDHACSAGPRRDRPNGDVRVLVGLYGAQLHRGGALNVLTVVAALESCTAGDGGVGALLAASGIGGLLGRLCRHSASAVPHDGVRIAACLLWGVPLALIGLATDMPLALAMLVLVGVGNTLVDVSAITLLQRATPPELLGRVFGVLESVISRRWRLGAAVAPWLFGSSADARRSSSPARSCRSWRSRSGIDCAGSTRRRSNRRRIELLRGDPIFAPLAEAIIEQLAGALEAARSRPATSVFHEGDAAIATLTSIDAAECPHRRGPGAAVALGARRGASGRSPSSATCRAPHRTRERRRRHSYGVRGDEFVSAVTGHATSAEAAHAVIAAASAVCAPHSHLSSGYDREFISRESNPGSNGRFCSEIRQNHPNRAF